MVKTFKKYNFFLEGTNTLENNIASLRDIFNQLGDCESGAIMVKYSINTIQHHTHMVSMDENFTDYIQGEIFRVAKGLGYNRDSRCAIRGKILIES